MFRKIRSNRAPEKTVWADLRDELAPYIKKIYECSVSILSRHPKRIFVCMLIVLIYSVIRSFSSDFKTGVSSTPLLGTKNEGVQNPTAITKGLNSISRTAENLRRTMTIRDKVDSVLNKKKLSQSDSVFLEDALLELKLIQQP
ncbi:hypothetical protein [Pedobacter psychrodurus]|uniref:hypothetical protein n=1 Tax=Pedobacter psychrodurus TaxID=2530456 RepID=UPI002930123F|nr:hypothetical protein [Pedobacter psychrodurus]